VILGVPALGLARELLAAAMAAPMVVPVAAELPLFLWFPMALRILPLRWIPVLPSKTLPLGGVCSPGTAGSYTERGRTSGWVSSANVVVGPSRSSATGNGSFAESALPLDSSGNFENNGVLVPLLFSDNPRWLKLRSPIPKVFTASSFSSEGFTKFSLSAKVSTTGLSTSFTSCAPLLLLFPPAATVVFDMLLLSVLAAFCAAENTEEKNPPPPGVVEPFSGVGVKGADIIFDNLLGPKVPDPDLILLCDIMFPDGEVTTFEVIIIGSGTVLSLPVGKRGELESVGVGGVLTIMGAGLSEEGGVRGTALVSINCNFPVFGLSGEDAFEVDSEDACLSGKIEPILEATLPRLASAPATLSFAGVVTATPLAFRSGLVLGLPPPLRGVKACFSLPTGEGDLFSEPFVGGRRELSTSDGVEAEAATASSGRGKVDARGVGEPARFASDR
jgi:hypothetical protein